MGIAIDDFRTGFVGRTNYPLADMLEILKEFSTIDLTTSADGKFEVTEIRFAIDELKAYLSLIDNSSIDSIDGFLTNNFYSKLIPVFNYIDRIRKFQVDESRSLSQQKNPIIQYFTHVSPDHYQMEKEKIFQLVRDINLFQLKHGDLDEKINKFKLDVTIDDVEKERQKILANSREIEALNSKMKEEYAKLIDVNKKTAETVNQKLNFAEKARKNKVASIWWLVAGIVSVILFLVVINCLFSMSSKEYTDFFISVLQSKLEMNQNWNFFVNIYYFEYFKIVFYKIVVLSVLLFVIRICIKNYNAERHNYTINDHKANSLDALFNILGDPSISPKAKDEMFTQGATHIFAHQATGFSQNVGEVVNLTSFSKILERVKS